MNPWKNFIAVIAAGLAALAGLVFVVFTFERPPVEVVQRGFRGTGQELVYNPRTVAKQIPLHQLPELVEPIDLAGVPAKEVYENVKVLGDLDASEFNRVMIAITAWVSPEQGCAYCHNVENMADDSVYTKIVARKMLQMTARINTGWQSHVAQTGVSCWTCHRGNPIPANVWTTDPDPNRTRGLAASAAGQNIGSPVVGLSSLPNDPFTSYFWDDLPIRVNGPTALPTGNLASIKQTEWTYGLMMHFSQATGANCTFCHNTQAFSSWKDAPSTRHNAFWGIRMVREINNDYIESIRDVFPPHRLGPAGDALKTNCATCHQGVHKPLYGASPAADYPELNKATIDAAVR